MLVSAPNVEILNQAGSACPNSSLTTQQLLTTHQA
jgi:hypothetical protein